MAQVARWLKVIGALLLVACFALPMKSCTSAENKEGRAVVVGADEAPAPGVRYVTERYYLWEELSAENPKSWLRVVVFVCPAAVVMFTRRGRKTRATMVLWGMEPVLLAGVMYSLWYMTFLFYDADVGWYVAVAGVTSYFAGWLGEAYQRWEQWRRRRRSAA